MKGFFVNLLKFFFLGFLVTSSVHANISTMDVKYHAYGDGVHDDTAALQSALTDCSNGTNLVCEIPAGKIHKITAPIFMWGSASLISSNHGGIKIDDTGGGGYLVNLGISGRNSTGQASQNYIQPSFTGTISNIDFSVVAGPGGRIIYFWRSQGATVIDNNFNVGPYAYSATSSGNNNNWLVNASNYIRKNVTIKNNVVVATASNIGNEGIGLGGFDEDGTTSSLIQGNVVTGVGDDPIGIHLCKNIKILSNKLRSVDGRIYVSSSQNIEIGNNKVIRIPSRANGVFYQGLALIYVGFEFAGFDNAIYGTNDSPDDNINIHDNQLYYPGGSIADGWGGISVFGVRHTTIAHNTIVSDAQNSQAIVVAPQQFQTYKKDSNGNYVRDGSGNLIPLVGVATWQDPTGIDTGLYKGGTFSFARGHEVTLDSNISASTQGVGRSGPFVMLDNCDTWVGPVTLTNNSAPAYTNFYSIYQACGLIVSNPNPNNTANVVVLDQDLDGYPDMFDNCPTIANADQADTDGNGVGDVCDTAWIMNSQPGLTGNYFANANLQGNPSMTRVDATIDMHLDQAPISGTTNNAFSVRWTGHIIPTVSGTYRLTTVTDDGVRLYVNGALEINSWQAVQSSQSKYVDINLVANQPAYVVMEYFNATGHAGAVLFWQPPSASGKVTIPSSNLRSK